MRKERECVCVCVCVREREGGRDGGRNKLHATLNKLEVKSVVYLWVIIITTSNKEIWDNSPTGSVHANNVHTDSDLRLLMQTTCIIPHVIYLYKCSIVPGFIRVNHRSECDADRSSKVYCLCVPPLKQLKELQNTNAIAYNAKISWSGSFEKALNKQCYRTS